MAMHRRVTLPAMGSIPFNPNRPNTLEQERQDFEKNQLNAILKSLNLEESAPKEKHVRTLIMGTYVCHGSSVFWRNVKDYASLHGNEVVTWKFLVIFYRILQDGQANVIKDSISEMAFLDQVSKYHRNSRTELASYGRLSATYGQLIISKLRFYRKYPEMPGNIVIKESLLASFDAAKNFELCVDFLDLLESIIQVKKLVLETFPPTKAFSMTASGQCRLSAIIPCTHDSSRIVEILGKMLRILHRHLPWDTLSGHRQRFRVLYNDLRQVYEKLSTIQYLRGIVQIPTLSQDISHFLGSLHRMVEVQENIAEEEPPLIEDDDTATGVGDLISVHEVSMAYIQSEYSDLSSKYQQVLQMFHEERHHREELEREVKNREISYAAEMESLKKQHEMALTAAAASASAASSSVDESAKLDKLKTAYQKLRNEHITLLRQKGDIDKEARELQAKSTKSQEREKELEAAILSFLEKAQIQHGNDLIGKLDGAAHKMETLSQMIQEKEELLNQLRSEQESQAQLRHQDLEHLQSKVPQLELTVEENLSKISQLNSQVEFLKESLELAKSEARAVRDDFEGAWRAQLRKMITKFASHLIAYPATTAPTAENIFGEDDPQGLTAHLASAGSSNLAATNDLLFYAMLSLLKIQPYANSETFDLKDTFGAAAKLLQMLKEENTPEVDPAWNSFLDESSKKMDLIRGIKWDPTDAVDKEIYDMQSTIEEAAAALEKLMLEARANEQSKPNIDVDIKILDSCCQLFAAIQEVIRNGRRLQNEISADSAALGTSSRPEFYRKNQKWSEGLISASKDIGRGAKLLVDSANAVVNEQGKFEELIAASQEIASSTAQMVVASKVKAKSDSKNLSALSTASKKVAEATAQVIATSRACFSAAENEGVDLEKLSFHQSKRLEMEIQIKLLELESQLQRERQKLFSLRKLQYANNNNGDGINNDS